MIKKNSGVSNPPKISIIVPIYNGEKYIDKCLASLTQQTYQNIEIVLINDGSIDGSLQCLEKFSKQDKRIILFPQKNQRHCGSTHSRPKVGQRPIYYVLRY